MSKTSFFASAVSAALLLIIINLVRTRRLRADHSLLWLLTGATVLLLAIWPRLLDRLAAILGIYYAPSVLLPVIILLGTAIFLSMSLKLSRQAEQIRELSHFISLMQCELETLKSTLEREKKRAAGKRRSTVRHD